MPLHVLIVEDDPAAEAWLRMEIGRFRTLDCELQATPRLSGALEALEASKFDAILLDLNLLDSRGIDTFLALQPVTRNTPVVVLSALDDELAATGAVAAGAQDYLVKGQADGAMLEHALKFAVARQGVERQFRSLLESAPDAMLILEPGGEVVVANTQAGQLLGVPAADLPGRNALQLLSADTRSTVSAALAACIEAGADAEPRRDLSANAEAADGRGFPVEVTLGAVEVDSGLLGVCSIRDVTQRRAAEQALRDSERRFRTLADASPMMIWIADQAMGRTWLNRTWTDFTGRTLESELAGGWMEGVHEDDAERLRRAYGELSPKGSGFRTEYRLRRHDGEYRWVLETLIPREPVAGDDGGFSGCVVDITDRKEIEGTLRKHALTDALTGLPNRLLFQDRLKDASQFARRHAESQFAVMFIDLDGFKEVNDTHGHETGDALLVEIGRRVEKAIRDVDTVSRWGGDEFVVLLRDAGDQTELRQVADRVLNAILEPFDIGDQLIQPGASIGIAISDTWQLDPEGLLRDADTAMYQVKTSGKRGWAIYGQPGGVTEPGTDA